MENDSPFIFHTLWYDQIRRYGPEGCGGGRPDGITLRGDGQIKRFRVPWPRNMKTPLWTGNVKKEECGISH